MFGRPGATLSRGSGATRCSVRCLLWWRSSWWRPRSAARPRPVPQEPRLTARAAFRARSRTPRPWRQAWRGWQTTPPWYRRPSAPAAAVLIQAARPARAHVRPASSRSPLRTLSRSRPQPERPTARSNRARYHRRKCRRNSGHHDAWPEHAPRRRRLRRSSPCSFADESSCAWRTGQPHPIQRNSAFNPIQWTPVVRP